MSSNSEIARVHLAETQFKLRPHLVADRKIALDSPLRVTLDQLLTPETVETLRRMGLIPNKCSLQ